MKHIYQKMKTFTVNCMKKTSQKKNARTNIVWKHSNIENLGEYHDLYLMTDVFLLPDVFENCKDMCLNYCGLDPTYYIILRNLFWNVFLSLTGMGHV